MKNTKKMKKASYTEWEQFFMETLEQYKDEFEPAPEVDPELPF
jgi:hypothetical protein